MANVATLVHHDVGLRSRPGKRYRIVFIPGNPGLIAYYSLFLQYLKSTLSRSPPPTDPQCGFDICARSLFGFESRRARPEEILDFDHFPLLSAPSSTLSLTEQVDHVQSMVEAFGHDHNLAAGDSLGLILIGHSVGAFILLEILHRFSLIATSQEKFPRIVGAICLFPTVLDIAKSSAGKKAKWLLQLPLFALVVSVLVKFLTFVLSDLALAKLVACITRFPKHATLATIAFLRSRRGVFQALSMAHDEMTHISADRWGEEIWGSPAIHRPPLFFYFGDKDHWVADSTRNYLISKRAAQSPTDESWKPVMEIDHMSVPHAFCIGHNEVIAQKCHSYINSIVQMDQSVQGPSGK